MCDFKRCACARAGSKAPEVTVVVRLCHTRAIFPCVVRGARVYARAAVTYRCERDGSSGEVKNVRSLIVAR